MDVVIMLSNHHVHLTEESIKTLFGDAGITFNRYLAGNSGPFASNEFVDLEGPKGKIAHVRVLGPARPYNQAELLKTDCFKLGVDAPVRASGKVDGAAVLKMHGPCGTIEVPCGILAHRHIHMGKDEMAELGLKMGDTVSVKIGGIRGLTFDNVLITGGGAGALMHVDTEEGNAAGVKNGDIVELVK